MAVSRDVVARRFLWPQLSSLSCLRNSVVAFASVLSITTGSNPILAAKLPFAWPPGFELVRKAPIHTESDHALACSDREGVWQGPYQEEYEDGTVAVSGRYKDGQPDDEWTFFYRDGARLSRGVFREGRRKEQWTTFYENGRKLAEGTYRDGEPDGHWTNWYEDGTRQSEGDYLAGEESGVWTYWFPNGRMDRTGVYHGRRVVPPRNASVPAESGKWTYWYESGSKRTEGCFNNGVQVGVWTEWSEEGKASTRKFDNSDCR